MVEGGLEERDDEKGRWAAETAALRGELRVHCYRMLGSSHDCDDVVQEALLRAWRARETLREQHHLRPWLYRIVTNVCLDELARRPRRALAMDRGVAAADPSTPLAAALDEPVWLEPMPDAWLDHHGDASARYATKESVSLAFLAALQSLTPRQRAALLLRDVVELPAHEVAAALGITLPAVNSALFRARAVLAERRPDEAALPAVVPSREIEALLARYVSAFERSDVAALVALLREDVTTTMPPSPTWIAGRAAHRVFYGEMFARVRAGAVRLRPLSCNGGPGFAFYRADGAEGVARLRAVEAITVVEGAVARIDHFMAPLAFSAFELPERLS